jgi:hypothetical protein
MYRGLTIFLFSVVIALLSYFGNIALTRQNAMEDQLNRLDITVARIEERLSIGRLGNQ